MKQPATLILLAITPALVMCAALTWAGNQVVNSDARRAQNQEIVDTLNRASSTVTELRHSYFGLLRYGLDRNPNWLKQFREAKETIPLLLKDLDHFCTTTPLQNAGSAFTKSLAVVVGLGEEVIWVSPLAPGDLCPIRARQLRFALQTNLRDLAGLENLLSEMLLEDSTRPYNFNVFLPLMFAVALTGTCAILAARILQQRITSEAKDSHQKLRKGIRAKRTAAAEITKRDDRAASLEAREEEILESVDAPLLLLEPDGRIVRANTKAKTFLEKLGNPEFLFTDHLAAAGINLDIERAELPSKLVLCKING